MATRKGIYRIKNDQGEYDVIHLETTAQQVIDNPDRRFTSDAEKSKWDNKANSTHSHKSSDISDANANNTPNTIIKRDANGDFSARNVTANLVGNSSTATKLATPRRINGVNFDGSADITITATPNTHTHPYLPLSGGTINGVLTVDAANGQIHAKRGTNLAVMTTSVTDGEYLFGGMDESYTGNFIERYIRIGENKLQYSYNNNTFDIYHTGRKPTASEVGARPSNWTPSWNEVQGKPSTFNPSAHNHNSSEVTALTGYAKPTASSAIASTDTLNAALGKLEKALDSKSNEHTHPYRPNTWVPSWGDVTGKPSFATVATSGSYNDLANKPTLLTINDNVNNSTTVTWSSKKIYDSIAGKANASHTHASTQITGLGTAATRNAGTGSGEVPILDSKGKLATTVLPSIAINETFTAANQDAALALTVEVGDIVVLTAPVNNATTFICINSKGATFDEKFKPLMSISDSVSKGELNTLLNTKVDKVSGKQLSTNDYTNAEKTKLTGIENNANNYVHPPKHAPSEISTDSNNRFVTDADKNNWNSKAAGNHNHDTVYAKINHTHNPGDIGAAAANHNHTTLNGVTRLSFNAHSNDSASISTTVEDIKTYLDFNLSDDPGQDMWRWRFSPSGGTTFSAMELKPINLNSAQLHVSGDIYAGGNRVYHQGFKPTASDIGALTQSTADSRYVQKGAPVVTTSLSICIPNVP